LINYNISVFCAKKKRLAEKERKASTTELMAKLEELASANEKL